MQKESQAGVCLGCSKSNKEARVMVSNQRREERRNDVAQGGKVAQDVGPHRSW